MTFLFIILQICLLAMAFCVGTLSQLNFTDSVIKKWEEDRKYFQDTLEVLNKK